jgi:Spy/CpxP family protein refolding chaperone
MKTRDGIILGGLLAATVLAALPLRAEENASPVDGKPKAAMCDMDCDKKGGGRGDFLKEKLGLTDEQSKKFDTVREAQEAEMEPLHEKMRTLSKKLEWQLSAKASDSEIKATLDELKSTHASAESSEKKFRDQMANILTPTQQAKIWVFKSEMMEHHGWGHRGGFAHHHDGSNRGGDEDEKED